MIAELRMWNLAILTMLVLLLVVSAGCIGGPDSVADRDIVVLKLNADGVAQWTKTIDTGEDDGAEDLVEFPGGGFAIAAQNGSDPRHLARPRFIRLSPDGTVQWDRFVTEGSDIARAVVPVGNGGTAVLTGNGTVVRFDDAGRIVWTRATGVSEAQALLRLADGGLVAGGRVTCYTNTNITIPPVPGASALPDPARFVAGEEGMAARLSADGGIVWERRYGGSGLEQAQSLVENPDDAGVLLVGVGERANATPDTPFLALRLAPDGTPQTVVQLGIGGPRTAAVPSGAARSRRGIGCCIGTTARRRTSRRGASRTPSSTATVACSNVGISTRASPSPEPPTAGTSPSASRSEKEPATAILAGLRQAHSIPSGSTRRGRSPGTARCRWGSSVRSERSCQRRTAGTRSSPSGRTSNRRASAPEKSEDSESLCRARHRSVQDE